MMNYFALSPTSSTNAQQTSASYAPKTQVQIPILLRVLSMALTNSLNNYQNALLLPNNQPQPSKQQQKVPTSEPQRQHPPQTAAENLPQLQSPIQPENKYVPKPTTPLPKRTSERKTKTVHHLSTSEDIAEDRPEKPKNERELCREEKTRKKSMAEGVAVRATEEPVVDMIECAYLPQMGLGRAQLAGIRQKLKLRQVDQWNEKIKNNREKRELRLLGC